MDNDIDNEIDIDNNGLFVNVNNMESSYNEENIQVLNRDSFTLIANIISIALIFGSVLNLIAQNLYFGELHSNALVFSLLLLFLGGLMQINMHLNIRDKIKIYFVVIIITLLIPSITLSFLEFASVTVWAIPFIFIVASLFFISRTMLVCVAISSLLTQAIVWKLAPEVLVLIGAPDYIVRMGLLVVAIVAAYYFNRLFVRKLKENAYYTKRIQELAYHDHLTGLPNRLLFNDRLNQAILAVKRTEKKLVVMFLDLDNFKMVNDTIGHEQGDILLKLVAVRLNETLREGDTVSRIGGDEFLILAQDVSTEDISEIAERIIKNLKKPFILQEQSFYVTTSVGVSVYPSDGATPDHLIKNADMAMYKAKEKGKNQFMLCSEGMKNEIQESMKLTNALYSALERKEMLLYYQPQISNTSGKIMGLEALIRWNHPELGLIPPDRFIPIAEKTGLITSIGEWVLNTACLQNKIWQDAGLPKIRIAVNLSVYQFQTPNIVNVVENILNETGLTPSYLELEITETVAMKEKGYIVDILNAFKRLGVTIALDDFGTTYSSLDYLKQLPVDRIKIAMSFVHGIAVSDKDEAITKAIIVLARNLGLNIVAEGVETKQQLSFLSGNMCDEIQGFYYYKAMPKEDIEKLLVEKKCFS